MTTHKTHSWQPAISLPIPGATQPWQLAPTERTQRTHPRNNTSTISLLQIPQVEAKAIEKATEAKGTHSSSPPHPSSSTMLTKLQSHPSLTHATMRNIKHSAAADRCCYIHTHTCSPSLAAGHTTVLPQKTCYTFNTDTNSHIHLPSIWCLLTCVSNPFSTKQLFLGGSPSPVFSCPFGDLRGIWLEYNGFVTSTLFPNFR